MRETELRGICATRNRKVLRLEAELKQAKAQMALDYKRIAKLTQQRNDIIELLENVVSNLNGHLKHAPGVTQTERFYMGNTVDVLQYAIAKAREPV